MPCDEESGSTLCEDQPLLSGQASVVSPINISDHHVQLLDISCNKKWIAYVSYYYMVEQTKPKIFVTRRRFTATDLETQEDEMGLGGNLASSTALEHSSIEITDYVTYSTCANSKFLSISNDGKYVALSFYEKDYGSRHLNQRKYINPDCLIFYMDGNLSDLLKIKCQGRAVFLNEEEGYRLAIVSKTTIDIYAELPDIKKVTCMFDLSGFYSNDIHTCSTVSKQDSYIKTVSWANMSYLSFDYDNIKDAENIIMFTRHIRHNILITPFEDTCAVRIWSLSEEGSRLCSFPARYQHVMALSTGHAYAAAYVENSRLVNIYNIKSGLLVYCLRSSEKSDARTFKVSHIRFCYDARYVAMSGLENDNEVVFEVWHLESERSIYRTTAKIVKQEGAEEMISTLRRVEPFVTRDLRNNEKCLKGYYTSYPNGRMTIMCVELKIDESPEGDIVNWKTGTDPQFESKLEVENGLGEFKYIKCGYIKIAHKKYLIRFGKHTVQLWHVVSNGSLITEDDELLYIRAYKGPDYGLGYSFRETWEIQDFDSIRYIGGNLPGRLIVNIRMLHEIDSYHTEEIFLPLEELRPPLDHTIRERKFDHHKLESACQALHYFYMEDPGKSYTNPNWNIIREKTTKIISSSISDIKSDCNFFSTIAGSRTLAMLASFEDGREMIKLILGSKTRISIFGYLRSQSEIDKKNRTKGYGRFDSVPPPKSRGVLINRLQSRNITGSNLPVITKGGIFYRSSMFKPNYRKSSDTTTIAPNENALTVLLDELSHDLYKLLFNRILLDSTIVGPGCLSSLTDTLLYLEEGRKHSLLLSSSAKLSYLEVDQPKLGILKHEYQKMIDSKILQKSDITDVDGLEAHATMEQIKMYKGYSLSWYRLLKIFLEWSHLDIPVNCFVYLYNRRAQYPWSSLPLNSLEELERYARVCSVPITHFNSYGDLYENRPRHTNIKEEESENKCRKKESTFVRVALDRNINDMFQQGDIVLELLLKYKWHRFARSKFILICFIHAIYYVSYCTSVLFAPELYGLDLTEDIFLEHPGQIVSIVLMVVSLLILIVQEFRQLSGKRDKMGYFFSGYNWIDVGAFLLPLFTLIQLCNNWPHFVEVCSISTLVLWTHAILRLRVISHFGVTLEIIIQLSKKIAPLLLIMLLVILAFTQSYIVLLRLEPDEYFRDTFTGVFLSKNSSGTGDVTFEGNVEFTTSSDNGFSNWLTAFYNVWLFIYGVWDPIVEGDAGSSLMVMGLSVVFSLTAVLIFFNMVM
ncbi:hypothetical protein BDF21DRAFT_491903 [Thamnidium elegans]|nr:hypothetical protein BDF21DRAFT_491903 [Thamnidium elegans]